MCIRGHANDGGTLGGGNEPSTFLECSFDWSHLTQMTPGGARFIRCTFRDVRIKDWFTGEAEFIGCVISGVIRKGYVSARAMYGKALNRTTNEYLDNDFSGTELIDIGFRGGVDLTRQVLPSGPEYVYLPDAARALAAVRTRVEEVAQGRPKELALMWLDVIQEDVDKGQRQLLFTPERVRLKDFDWHEANMLLLRLFKEFVGVT
jgi:hypothetical protein